MPFRKISCVVLLMKVFLIAIVALAGCGNNLTRERALASVTNLPEFSTTMGSTPHPADVRIDGIYHENSSQATVHATFSYPIAGPSPDEGCSVQPSNNILEDCPLYTKMVRYGGRWGTDRGELARRQANEDTLRRFHDETAKQRQRLENLRAANDQLKEEIKALQSP
jgi:hypothetical protein